jgi:hypothetical protein
VVNCGTVRFSFVRFVAYCEQNNVSYTDGKNNPKLPTQKIPSLSPLRYRYDIYKLYYFLISKENRFPHIAGRWKLNTYHARATLQNMLIGNPNKCLTKLPYRMSECLPFGFLFVLFPFSDRRRDNNRLKKSIYGFFFCILLLAPIHPLCRPVFVCFSSTVSAPIKCRTFLYTSCSFLAQMKRHKLEFSN